MANSSLRGKDLKSSSMYNPGSTNLARLRPEKLDDAAIQTQIALIQQSCGEIDPDQIALVFHECDYNLRTTIDRLKSGSFEAEGWKTAKSNNKKKINHPSNGHFSTNDNERSIRSMNISQRRQEIPSTTQIEEKLSDLSIRNSNEENSVTTTRNESLRIETNEKKNSLPSTKRSTSSIPHQPVSMHPTIQFSTASIDVQFGDVQWNDSMLIDVNSSTTLEDQPATTSLSSETTNPNTQVNENPIQSFESTSHLSDQLNQSTQENIQSTSTPHSSVPQTTNGNPSAFTPYPTSNIYPSMPRDFSQSATTTYKPLPTPTIAQLGSYPPQTSYPVQPPQQYYVGNYPYPTPTVFQLIAPMEPWPTTAFASPMDPYSAYPNFVPNYPTAAPYQPHTGMMGKYHQNEKDYSNNDLVNSSQQVKEGFSSSKLSATAAAFSQGAPSPPGAFFLNPVSYPFPTYYLSPQDRTISYSSNDNRDNRNGASFNSQSNRNSSHQRQHPNSSWHMQQ